jgi:hypothetical protein
MTVAFPLHWPPGMARNRSRISSRFKTTLPKALDNVEDELRRFGTDTGKRVENVLISSNYSLGTRNPTDGGVACYFRWDNIDCCLAVDRYSRIEENLQAIALVIEAERTKMRHGGLNIVRSSFRGYANLPPPKGPDGQLAPPWRHVLKLPDNASMADADARYRQLVKEAHPDVGGDAAKFNQITDAIRQAREELKP